jgi:predicted PurR-regulated permease PerM
MQDSERSPTPFTGRVVIAVAVAVTAAVAGLLVWRLASVWILLFASALFGVALRSASGWLSDRTGMPVGAALALWILVGVLLLGGFFWFVASSLVAQFADLTDRIPRALESLREWAMNYSFLRPVARDVEAIVNGASGTGPDTSTYIGSALDASRFTLGTLGNLLVMSILTIYMALDLRRYANGTILLVPGGWRDTARELLDAWSHALPWWLAARFTSMTVVAILVTLGLTISGVPLPLVLGLIAGMFSFVPFFGPIASVVPAVLVGFSDSATAVIAVLIVFAIVQFLESYLITPLIERRAVSIPLFPLIAAQLVAGALFGVPGIIFATPLLLAVTIAVQVVYQRRILGEDVPVWGRGA